MPVVPLIWSGLVWIWGRLVWRHGCWMAWICCIDSQRGFCVQVVSVEMPVNSSGKPLRSHSPPQAYYQPTCCSHTDPLWFYSRGETEAGGAEQEQYLEQALGLKKESR